MPSWQKLLDRLCAYLDDQKTAEGILQESLRNNIPLEDCARILELRFLKEKKDFREKWPQLVGQYVPFLKWRLAVV
jgi:hypothetical protein